ncbi:hypothetical protein [Enterobacter hormaechei]|uniref:hypothetical protein n=1 Tax=Enterobacter hormaechei TaxID=158836 RepID=UPI001E5CE0EA|nr:hypothetical protein [Enterobacter hormaechei]MCC4525050.1 hypothetical protein [Enterobacter hormaechei]MCC4529135.1 hypothetical protein [Enterobacter hormaechei]MCC4534383.1 hypothetical protein [Enterobacter hormaechei]MCC4538759.1 hypothetical protein [Enterobacter hormaechei]
MERYINAANKQFESNTWEEHVNHPGLLICEEGQLFDTIQFKLCKQSHNERYTDGGYNFISYKGTMYNVHDLMGSHYLPVKPTPTDVYDHKDTNKRNNEKSNIHIVPKRVNNVSGTKRNEMLTYEEYRSVMNLYSLGERSQNSLRKYVLGVFGKDTDDTLYTRLVKGETYVHFYEILQEEDPAIISRISSVLQRKGRK